MEIRDNEGWGEMIVKEAAMSQQNIKREIVEEKNLKRMLYVYK